MDFTPTPKNPVLLFGCGNMGRAMLDGWIAGGVDPAAIHVIDPAAQNLPAGVKCFATAADAGQYGLVIVAIKPQLFDQLKAEIASAARGDALVISILAGTQLDAIQAAFPGRRVLRLMPNLSVSLGLAPLGLWAESQDGAFRAAIEALLAPLGSCYWLESEAAMDSFIALAGSGPAFVYRYIEALAAAGEALGIAPGQSEALAKQMVRGAAELAARAEVGANELAARVASKGGTTAAGLAVLDADQALAKLVAATLRAAHDRGVAMASE